MSAAIKDALAALWDGADMAPPRPHLGASVIGMECDRKLWYGYRWAKHVKFGWRIQKLFERGRREEPWVHSDFRRIGMEVITTDEGTNGQLSFWRANGQFSTSLDGVLKNVPGEHPEKPHLFECKTYGNKSFNQLVKAGDVAIYKPEHYAQMQVCMGLADLPAAVYYAVNKDTDDFHVQVVQFDESVYGSLVERAQRIIGADDAPDKEGTSQTDEVCLWCDYSDLCHLGAMEDGTLAQVNCRTCAFSTPDTTGKYGFQAWECSKGKTPMGVSVDNQIKGCCDHVYIPSFVPYRSVSADKNKGVTYENDHGKQFVNGPRGWPSAELRVGHTRAGDESIEAIRERFGATVYKVDPINEDEIPF